MHLDSVIDPRCYVLHCSFKIVDELLCFLWDPSTAVVDSWSAYILCAVRSPWRGRGQCRGGLLFKEIKNLRFKLKTMERCRRVLICGRA